jgi:hypothetical protein
MQSVPIVPVKVIELTETSVVSGRRFAGVVAGRPGLSATVVGRSCVPGGGWML